jgi:outer membrane protein, heavy metal efflux system
MTMRVVLIAVMSGVALGSVAHAQPRMPRHQEQLASAFVDPIAGLTLEQAIAQALEQEPSLRAARTAVDGARGMRLQAGLRPNPTFFFAQQNEPAGTDSQTRVEVEWPLDLFRKAGRVAVAEQEIEATRQATADRERLLAAEVRMKYGDVVAAVRELAISDELVTATSAQHRLVSARVEQGATPPLERDVLRVELQRLESDRLLQAGHVEHVVIDLKRLLGLTADAPLRLKDTLEQLVHRESSLPVPADDVTTVADRPDVREAGARIQLAQARMDQARREGRLDMSAFGMYMRTDSGFPQRGFGPQGDLERVRGVFHYVAAGAMVTVPIRNRNQGEVAATQARRAGAVAELEAVRLTAYAEIAAARARDAHAQRAVATYSSDARTLAKQNLDVVGQTYELGRMTLFDVLSERRRYVEVERAYTNALREAYEARQALRRALGEVR